MVWQRLHLAKNRDINIPSQPGTILRVVKPSYNSRCRSNNHDLQTKTGS